MSIWTSKATKELKNMKYLSDYTQEAMTKALNKAGAFFAFGDKQFKEQQKKDIKYISLDAGLICPKNTANELVKELNNTVTQGIKQDIKENGKRAIIKRELANYETYYTGDITDTVDALKDYKFTAQEILKIFRVEQSKNLDW